MKGEAVVLVHGIWMSGLEMSLLRRRLTRCGFRCYRFRYPSLSRSPAENARALHHYLDGLGEAQVHLVVHSLGGLVVHHLLDQYPVQCLARVVMLGTPAAGSELARRLQRQPLLRPLLGRATEHGLLGDGPPWRGGVELGVIAGSRGFGVGTLFTGGRLQRPSDGTVSVVETEIEAPHQRLILPCSHFGLLFSAEVARQLCRFLAEGVFDPDPRPDR